MCVFIFITVMYNNAKYSQILQNNHLFQKGMLFFDENKCLRQACNAVSEAWLYQSIIKYHLH